MDGDVGAFSFISAVKVATQPFKGLSFETYRNLVDMLIALASGELAAFPPHTSSRATRIAAREMALSGIETDVVMFAEVHHNALVHDFLAEQAGALKQGGLGWMMVELNQSSYQSLRRWNETSLSEWTTNFDASASRHLFAALTDAGIRVVPLEPPADRRRSDLERESLLTHAMKEFVSNPETLRHGRVAALYGRAHCGVEPFEGLHGETVNDPLAVRLRSAGMSVEVYDFVGGFESSTSVDPIAPRHRDQVSVGKQDDRRFVHLPQYVGPGVIHAAADHIAHVLASNPECIDAATTGFLEAIEHGSPGAVGAFGNWAAEQHAWSVAAICFAASARAGDRNLTTAFHRTFGLADPDITDWISCNAGFAVPEHSSLTSSSGVAWSS